ncbi:MAG: SDR family oxidoreductase [Clostridiales bacterium]|nr:SDR family oxidoreductase [Clostridiales bacterium]
MKTALITGGSRGIGAACVKTFCNAGYGVCFLYHFNEEAALRVRADTGAIPIRCNVADPEDVRRAMAEVKKHLPHIDVLVNNAGIASSGLLTDVTDAEWRQLVDVNLSGCFYLCRETLPGMISRREGSIVNISSIWGQVGASCEAAYSAVKAGIIGLTKALAKEAGPSHVRVNCVAPGVIRTDMLSCYTDDDLSALAEETSLGRLGTPEDVARAVLWLSSSDAAFITGEVLGVNGGFW